MEVSWERVRVLFGISPTFDDYFSNIGRPFEDILKRLNIFENQEEIKKIYNEVSVQEVDKCKVYEGVIKGLKELVMNGINIGIVTSKDASRMNMVIKKLDVDFSVIRTPDDICRGKPSPDHLLMAMAMQNIDPVDTLFVGDMDVDYMAASRAGVDYVHASWGYGKCNDNDILHLNKFSELSKYIKGK
jgi:phosphoglycolate phosphatase